MRRGLSLVEVLAATALMSMLLVPIFLMMQFSTASVYRSTNDILASSLAIAKIEELRSLPYHQVENILLGLPFDDTSRETGSGRLFGPFEPVPARPDIAEPSLYTSGGMVFHRYTWLSYFPDPNPSTAYPDFDRKKRRIKVNVQIFWRDRLSKTVALDQDLSFETIIHDEGYNPKPGYNAFLKDAAE